MTDQAIASATPATLRARTARWVESPRVQRIIVAVILVNAVTLGLETWDAAMAAAGGLLVAIDRLCLAIFVLELLAKLFGHGRAFFRSPWNLFDLAVVGVSLVPAGGNLSVLRALRILRVLRLLSVVPEMRRVIQALFGALPGMGSIIAVLALVFYVAAVLATKLFGDNFEEWFGTIGRSMYSLFQIMTLESWSMGIVRPVMEVYPAAWLFFVPFIVLTSFAVLNLFIALIVNSMQSLHESEKKEEEDLVRAAAHEETQALASEIGQLRREIAEIKQMLAERR